MKFRLIAQEVSEAERLDIRVDGGGIESCSVIKIYTLSDLIRFINKYGEINISKDNSYPDYSFAIELCDTAGRRKI